MESSIAVFLKRWQACELPPTGAAAGPNTMHHQRSRPHRRTWGGHQCQRTIATRPPSAHTQSAGTAAADGRRRARAGAAHPCGRGNSAISDA